jgi:ABC-type phosphate/phosphonate transport system substrate-binding protein
VISGRSPGARLGGKPRRRSLALASPTGDRLFQQLPRLLLLAGVLAVCAGAGDAPDVGASGIRMGMSASLISADKNENDIRAALKTWADMFSREAGFRIAYLQEVVSRPDELLQRIKLGQLDAFALSTAEYQQAAAYVDRMVVIVDEAYVNGGEEYLVLVHTDSGIKKLSDLRGHNLIRYSADNMGLAPDWLVILLETASLGTPETFFSNIALNAKISRAVLPVFFRQSDACLVNRRAFETMGEKGLRCPKAR